MKLVYFLHALSYVYLIYLGFDVLEIERGLSVEFSEIEWEASHYVLHNAPVRSYFNTWVWFSLGTIIYSGILYGKKEEGKAVTLVGLSFFILFLLYFTWGSSMEENQFSFLFFGLLQIGTSLFFSCEDWMTEFINLRPKHFFFLLGMSYLGLLIMLFSFFLDIENSILTEIEEIGRQNYTGINEKLPGEVYCYMMFILTVFISGLWLWRDESIFSFDEGVDTFLMLFFMLSWASLMSSFLRIDDLGSKEGISAGLFLTTLTQSATILLTFILSIKLENKLPKIEKKPKFYNSDILDENTH